MSDTFARWCAINGAQPIPASPASVARFVLDIAPLGIQQVWELVCEISRDHYTIGLADPTQGGPVSAALNTIAKIEPPRAWPKQYKFRFEQLPYDLQAFFAAHENRREKEIRRAHSEANLARNELASIQQPPKVTNGNPQINPA